MWLQVLSALLSTPARSGSSNYTADVADNQHLWPLLLTWFNIDPSMDK